MPANPPPQALPPTANSTVWHTLPPEEALQLQLANREGLSATEAEVRLAAQGLNTLQEAKHISLAVIFAAQFKSLIVWILLIAGIIAGVLGEMLDAMAILTIVVLNGVIGAYQEYKAEKTIAALRKLTAPQARVRREGKALIIPATQLVAGDILEIEAGDLVAADARLLSATSLRCVEATLTGEAEAVTKDAATLPDPELPLGDRANMVFKGTSIATGQGAGLIVATGMKTELGRIAGLMQQAGTKESTPLQEKLEAFGRVLVWVSLGIVSLLFVLGLIRGMPFIEILMTSVSLAVAAIPEGLPAIVTVALALGVLRMSHRGALVRKLPAVETLGSTNVICTDKTGTLTVGDMTVREFYVAGQSFEVTGEGYGPHGEVLFEGRATGSEHTEPLLELATSLLACNNAELVLEDSIWRVVGDPTEGAMLAAGGKAGGKRNDIERDLPRHHEVPFDSDRKRRTVVRKMPGGQLRAFLNGAPDVLLKRCSRIYTEEGLRPITDADRTTIAAENERMAARALRVLGSAFRDLPHGIQAKDITEDMEHELVFVGLAGMHDPPRPGAKEAVARCHAAGIRVVMITGDHPHTALAIAREMGIANADDTAVSGTELNALDDDALKQRAPHIAVYARVTAEHKLRVIRALQATDAVVAMTGDGVNDAPALKGADIGIAMGMKGTEVTKQASDMVVTDDNFSSIVAAIEQGRGIYANIRKTLQYLLAGNAAELLLMTVCIVVGLPSPLLPIHLLWINLVTDGLPALCLATEPIDPDVMNHPPRLRKERLTDRGFLPQLVLASSATGLVSFGVYYWALKHGSVEAARSIGFTALVFCELFKSFSFRSETKTVWQLPLLANPQLPLVVAASFVMQLLLHHVPVLSEFLKTVMPDWPMRWALLGLGFVPLIVLEAAKLLRAKWHPPLDLPPAAAKR